jgi:hypothetical protein
VLEEHRVAADSLKLPELYKHAASVLALDSKHPAVEELLRQLVRSGAAIVHAIAELRNKVGDAHGKGAKAPKPSARQARFAVALSGAVAAFLMDSLDAQRM